MKLPEHVNLLRKHSTVSFARCAGIQYLLEEHLKLNPLEWDMNHHLQVAKIAQEVAGEMVASGYECSSEDVLLVWVSQLVTVKG